MRRLLLLAVLAVVAHPLLGEENSTKPPNEPIFQQLLDRIASLEKRIATLEAAGKQSSAMPVMTVPQPEIPRTPFSSPIQSGPPTAYPERPPQRPLTVPDGPANQWNKIEINGQNFYIAPAKSVADKQVKMPNYLPR